MSDSASQESSKSIHSLDADQREALEELLAKQAPNVIWGYKNISNQSERDIAARSQESIEEVFATLHKDDPENARIVWQKHTKRPADAGLISRAKGREIPADKEGLISRLKVDQSTFADEA